MNQLKEYLIWIVLGIPGMVLIGLVLHSLVHFETGVLELHIHELQLSTLGTEHCDAAVVACLDEIIDVYAGAVGRIDSLADIFLPGSLDDTRTVVGIHAIV